MKRRATTLSSALIVKNTKRSRSGKTYFDILPFELLVHLLRFIPAQEIRGYCWPIDIVNIASVSNRIKKAVIEAFRYKLDFSKGRNSHGFLCSAFHGFAKLFGKRLREINLVYPDSAHDGVLPAVEKPALRITSLRKASIAGKKKHFEIIQGNRFLTHLEVTMCPQFRMTWKSLINTLKTLPLESLTLHISSRYSAPAVRTLARLANACQQVRELSFGNGFADYTRYWRLIIGLPRLEKLAINGNVFRDPHMDLLRTIPELKVTGWIPIDKFLPHTSNVLWLRLTRPCSKSVVSKLGEFRSLRNLALQLEEGAEFALPTAVYNLETLHIEWVCHSLLPRHQTNVDEDFYYHADTEAIIHTIRNATQLRDLAIYRVYLPTVTILRVIKMMGKNLRSLGINLDMQKEHPGRRLGIVLFVLAYFCPRIERLDFYGSCRYIPASTDDKDLWLGSARMARDKCPDLDMTRINFFLSSIAAE